MTLPLKDAEHRGKLIKQVADIFLHDAVTFDPAKHPHKGAGPGGGQFSTTAGSSGGSEGKVSNASRLKIIASMTPQDMIQTWKEQTGSNKNPTKEELMNFFSPVKSEKPSGEAVPIAINPPETSGEQGDLKNIQYRIVLKKAYELSNKLGFDGIVEVHTPDVSRNFSVAGRNFTSGGTYYVEDNHIEIYSKSFVTETTAENPPAELAKLTETAVDDYLPGLMAHEVMHGKFAVVQRALQDETKAVMNDPEIMEKKYTLPGGDPRHKVAGMEPNGTLRSPELRKKYPIYSRFQEFEKGSSLISKLAKEDGNTAYSEAYWKPDALNKGYGHWRAINETLAEMASKDFRNKLSGERRLLLHGSDLWVDYYNAHVKTYDELAKDPARLKKIRGSFKDRPFYG